MLPCRPDGICPRYGAFSTIFEILRGFPRPAGQVGGFGEIERLVYAVLGVQRGEGSEEERIKWRTCMGGVLLVT